MNEHLLKSMLQTVACNLGDELLPRVAFVGGCVVPLLVTDRFSRDRVRATDDVDLIVEVVTWPEYHSLGRQLRACGFREAFGEGVSCRWRLSGITVDIMPTDESILGFSNRWYPDALRSANWFPLDGSSSIRVVKPELFLATKIEAFEGRGHGDFLSSRDMEDILSLLDGRPAIVDEVRSADDTLRGFIAGTLAHFRDEGDFEYAVQSIASHQESREEEVFRRIDGICSAK